MKAQAFAYARARTIEEAIALLAEHGPDARILAGGQSLMAMMNFRLATPSVLVDINRVPDLDTIEDKGDVIRIGTLARHAAVQRSSLVHQHLPMIAEAMEHVAHPAIRTRGTHGGSLAHADPAAELPACALALAATMVVRGAGGTRTIAAERFFKGFFEVDLAPGEMLVAVDYPKPTPGARSYVHEFSRRLGDYAMTGLAAHTPGPGLGGLRLAYFGVSGKAELAPRTAEAVTRMGSDPAALRGAASILASEIDFAGDVHASADMKRHLAGVLLKRAVAHLTRQAA